MAAILSRPRCVKEYTMISDNMWYILDQNQCIIIFMSFFSKRESHHNAFISKYYNIDIVVA